MAERVIADADGTLSFRGETYRCALGRGGVRRDKREGDGATPAGCFSIRKILYRPDRLFAPPESFFPVVALSVNDGWSDDITRPEYNTHVTLPYNGSHEKLWRDDHLYDVVVPLGYNDAPALPGKGSAIFMHVAREGYAPTEGCIALSQSDLLAILKTLSADAQVCVRDTNG